MAITKGRWVTKGADNTNAQVINVITVSHKDEKVYGDAGEIIGFKELMQKWEPLDNIALDPERQSGFGGNPENQISSSSMFSGLNVSKSHEKKVEQDQNKQIEAPKIIAAEIINDVKEKVEEEQTKTVDIVIKSEADERRKKLTSKQKLIAEALEVSKENFISSKEEQKSLVLDNIDIDFNFNIIDIVNLSKTFNVSVEDVSDVILSDEESRETLKNVISSIIEAVLTLEEK